MSSKIPTRSGTSSSAPIDPTIGSYCHEGPWNLVTQRIWLLDFVSREAKPCFRQDEQDSIGHEFWTQDGYIFFDDRGPGHDGTITSDRTQAVATDVAVKQQEELCPLRRLADRFGNLVQRIDMPFYCNHYHANPDHTILVGDDVDDLVLIDISGETAQAGSAVQPQDLLAHPDRPLPPHLELGRQPHPVRLRHWRQGQPLPDRAVRSSNLVARASLPGFFLEFPPQAQLGLMDAIYQYLRQ